MLRANKRTSNLSIERLQKTAKRATKAAKLCILTELCYKIDQVKQRQDRIPYGFVSGLVRESRSVFPWVTRDAINNHYRKIQREPLPPLPPPPPPPPPPPRPPLVPLITMIIVADTLCPCKERKGEGGSISVGD